jgi:peptidoglycan/xylan/chitin deacetylase (PgdA/CDA1 family)
VGNGIWSQQEVYEIWMEEFEGVYAEGGYYNLMMHPQVIGRHHRMRMVERLVRHMRAKRDVWFATPLEIARYWADHLAGGNGPGAAAGLRGGGAKGAKPRR